MDRSQILFDKTSSCLKTRADRFSDHRNVESLADCTAALRQPRLSAGVFHQGFGDLRRPRHAMRVTARGFGECVDRRKREEVSYPGDRG
jgi:hypothetical protein